MSARPVLRILWPRCPGAPVRPGLQNHSASPWRSFTTSYPRCAAPKKSNRVAQSTPKTTANPIAKPIAEPIARPSAQPAAPLPNLGTVRFGNIGKLAAKIARQGEVLLFKAPTKRVYFLSAYGLSAACIFFAVWHSENYIANTELAQPTWIKALMGGVCVVMSGLGVVVLSRTHNIVRSITALHSEGHTRIRFQVRRLVPFMKPRTFEVLPSQVSFRRRLVVSPQNRVRYESDSMKLGGAGKPQKSFFKAPIERLSRSIWGVFMSVRQLFTQEDFILLEVDGKGVFRVDSNGVVTEDFMALGNPVKYSDY